MRAVTVADGQLVLAERPRPEPGPSDVVVRVHGAGLNRADLLQRAGRYPPPPGLPPDIPGLEFAGVVEACGTQVTTPTPGAEVFGIVGGGAQAEYVRVPAAHCAAVPRGLDLIVMGGVPEAYITAHDALVEHAHVARGDWVLIHAVGSGVGIAGLQLAQAFGARVIGTSRTPDKLERSRRLGLTAAVTAGARGGALGVEAMVADILAATGGGVDVVLDLVGGSYVEVDIAAAGRKARVVCIGALAGSDARLDVLSVMGKRLSIIGTVLRARDDDEKADATRAFARDVVPLLAAETIAPVVDAVMSIEQAADAYDLLASDATFGKVILDCR
jgi:putative PIG3 family NAD(P)H quinone oxidoreductase